MITKKQVNKAISEHFAGLDIRLENDQHHNFWYEGLDTEYWFDKSAMIWTLNQRDVQDFIREIEILIERNASRKPDGYCEYQHKQGSHLVISFSKKEF